MNLINVSRHAIALTLGGLLAPLLSDCAIRSSPIVPSQNNAGAKPAANQIFEYTGKKQTFMVPPGVTRLTIAAYGASGGNVGSYTGGLGGFVKAKVPVTPGESLSVFVGESGHISSRSAFNGGGAGSGRRHHRSGGGGGASDVRLDTGVRILIAAGGGGAGAASGEHVHRGEDPFYGSGGYGGDGGGKVGIGGSGGSYGSYGAPGGGGGGGGGQTAGGSGGMGGGGSGSCRGLTGGNGSRHMGGSGGSACYAAGGGGGGGLYGGGGGGGSGLNCGRTYYGEFGYCAWGGGGGGGGGSSFIETSATTIKNVTGGAPPGDGRVEISW